MCFSDDDYSYESRFEVRNGRRYYAEDYHPRFGMSRRRKYGLGGSYYPSRYYVGPPRGRHISNAVIRPNSYSQSGGGYPLGVVPRGYSRSVPGRYSQTMVPRGLAGCGYPGYSSGYANGTGYHVGTRDVLAVNSAIRTYYNTVPTYGYTAHVYPPGPTTTTTTYHVTNSQAQNYSTPITQTVRETRPAYVHSHAQQGPTREDIQMESRRLATERGSYDPRKIRPADARDDDPFWCREVNGEWHLRSYYQIENECHPGRWMMDADIGFLAFHRA